MTKVLNKTADINFINRLSETQASKQEKLGKIERKPVKDYIAPSSEKKQEKESLLKTTLPQPTTGFSGLSKGGNAYDNQPLGLIAIIAEVMISQAKCSSNFWSTLWNNASSEMKAQVELAPVIGAATENAFNEQKNATMAQANEAKASGLVNISAFAGGIIVGGYMGFNAAEEEAGQSATKVTSNTEEDVTDAADAASDEAGSPAEGLRSTESEVNQGTRSDATTAAREANDSGREAAQDARNDRPYENRAKEGWEKVKGVMERIPKNGGRMLKDAFTQSLSMQQASDAIVKLTIVAPQKTIEANAQGKQGQFQSQEKQLEQYAQFYGQAFSRSNELTQSAEQSFKNALSLMQGAIDQITQTSVSMLQG